MGTLLNILMEIGVIMTVLVTSYLCGNEEAIYYFTCGDLGLQISGFGLFWFIGAFMFRIAVTREAKFTSIFCAIAVFIFGWALSDYGIYHAWVFLGFALIYISWLISAHRPVLAFVIFLISLGLIFINNPLKQQSVPTKNNLVESTGYKGSGFTRAQHKAWETGQPDEYFKGREIVY